MNFFRAVGCVTGLKQLDFGGDPDHLGIREFFCQNLWSGGIGRILWDELPCRRLALCECF